MKFLVPAAAVIAAVPTLALGAEAPCAELTGLQVAAGFVTWMNILRIFAIVGGALCIAVLMFTTFGRLLGMFAQIPMVVYEILSYALGISLVLSGVKFPPNDLLWPVLTGSIILAAIPVISATIRKLEPNRVIYFAGLTVLWSAIALSYDSHVIGFMAVGAFMGMIGFSAFLIPMGYAVGFEDEAAVGRGILTGFLTTMLAVLTKVITPTAFNPFIDGALWLGPFVLFIGLLIAASRYYDSRTPYIMRQVLPLVLGFAAIGIGSVFGISQLSGIGGTFFVLFLIEKASDIPAKSLTGYALIGLLTCGVLGYGVWWAQNHMDVIQPYLLF